MRTHKNRGAVALGLFLLIAAVSYSAHHELALTALDHGPAPEGVKVSIVSPAEGEVLAAGESVSLQLASEGFALGELTEGSGENGLAFSSKGQHVHVIVDNGPYKAVYDVSQPVDLGDLGPGVHTIEAFASRSWHESVKTDGARQAVTFYVGENTGAQPIVGGAPLVSYSRPKGTYKGADGEKIMVDFYLTNVSLSEDGYKVRVTVDGKSATVTDWRPYAVEGLGAGTHAFQVELLDADGNAVEGDYNSTSREITIE